MAPSTSSFRSRPPTLRDIGPGIAMHLRELAGRRDAWLVLMRNAVPLLVPLMAVVLSYLEIWPERAIGMVWGDPSRLHEDPKRGLP